MQNIRKSLRMDKVSILKSEILAEMSLNQRSVTAWNVQQQGEWTSELGIDEGIDFPKIAWLRFQQSEGLNDQLRKNDSFYRLSVSLAQCIIGPE